MGNQFLFYDALTARIFQAAQRWLVAKRNHEKMSAATTSIQRYSAVHLMNTKWEATTLNAIYVTSRFVFCGKRWSPTISTVLKTTRGWRHCARRANEPWSPCVSAENIEKKNGPNKQAIRPFQFRQHRSNHYFVYGHITMMRWTEIVSLHCHFKANSSTEAPNRSRIFCPVPETLCTLRTFKRCTHVQSLYTGLK